jgi:arylsulfatase A
MQSRRQFLGGLAGFTATFNLLSATAGSLKKPNIVLFLVDDLGWGDFGCYGDTFHETPNIDHLAADGMKFTNAYAAAPVCSPSRASLLTGKWPARLHLTQWLPGVIYPHKKLLEPTQQPHLDHSITTIAQQLKQVGYQTAAMGKWHLSGDGYLPENFGFDVNIAGTFTANPLHPTATSVHSVSTILQGIRRKTTSRKS